MMKFLDDIILPADAHLKEFEKTLDNFLNKLNNNKYSPREWFIQNHGKYNSGRRLKKFVQEVFKEDELNFKWQEVDYLRPGI